MVHQFGRQEMQVTIASALAAGRRRRTGISVNLIFRVPTAQVVEQARLVQMHKLRVVANTIQDLRVGCLGQRLVKVGRLRSRSTGGNALLEVVC